MRLKKYKIRNVLLMILLIITIISVSNAQDDYGNQWIFGRFSTPNPSGTLLKFNNGAPQVTFFNKPMELEASCAVMCDSVGKLLFYSNGCYIANANHQVMINGDGIGKDKLETSFCNSGGNPLTQGIIALPKPGSNHLYYLFYTDIGDPYATNPNVFPLAPENMYYSVIDMAQGNSLGEVVEKNIVIVQDTLALGMMHANRHANGSDWWIFMPESQTNCYWTLLLTQNGIDTMYKQCTGVQWLKDPQGQSVFSPNSKKYVRFNYFHGLNIFDFNNLTGLLSNPVEINFGLDTFYYGGAAFSPNSRFLYVSCYDKVWQFDLWATDIPSSRILIGELNTPPSITTKTRFNQARLGPDGKIYISGTGSFKHLHIIHRPNCYGSDCDLEQYAVELAATSTHTLPNMPHYKTWSESDTCQTVSVQQPDAEQNVSVKFYPNPVSDGYLIAEGLAYGDKIQFFDVTGRVVKNIDYTSERLDMSEFDMGFYFVKIWRQSLFLGAYKVIVKDKMR
jgi:Secretion system C-terminal sorting domain